MSSSSTPMFRQYRDLKSRHEDAILMFRMGDFYEMFFEDALSAAPVLEITLTTRGKGTRAEAPMCGVPFHAADSYIGKLVAAGFKVAICEQMEDAASTKGLVKRDVVRVVTPGTITDSRQLNAGEPNTLGAVLPAAAGASAGVAWVDLSTGDFRHATMGGNETDGDGSSILELLGRFNCRELLLPDAPVPAALEAPPGILVNRLPAWQFGRDRTREILKQHLGTAHLEAFGDSGDGDESVAAAGALLEYLNDTQKAGLGHIDRLRRFQEKDHLILDGATVANLEIVRNQREGKPRGALLATIDRTVTSMGRRLLKERLLHPLKDIARIRRRLAMVGDLVERAPLRQRLRAGLEPVADMERLLARLTLGTATPREFHGLGHSLALLPALQGEAAAAGSDPLRQLLEALDPVDDVATLLHSALVDEPPAHLRDGGAIRDGFDEELGGLRRLARDGRAVLAGMESEQRQLTGIATLKIRYNRVFGYFIEVSKSNLSRVPPTYIRKQTLTGAERYVTPELKDLEEKLLNARERMLTRETEIVADLRQQVLAQSSRLRLAARTVARLDVAAALAETAARQGWCLPEVNEEDAIIIEAGRHPVVESVLGKDRFVPNDIHLDTNRQIQIITGPNMGGKSTILRQTGLTVLLAQAGSFVPATRACIGVADRIFCRVGASDSLASGHSTFMVEMTETANILHHATPRSLVLLDEIGRGTATFDGLSIAWAVVEHLHERQGVAARTLFATHYHELTELALVLPRVVNLRITAREHAGRIIFLHRLEDGAADQSYGIQVAALAGVPPEVVERAREILTNLEADAVDIEGRPRLAARPGRKGRDQMGLFGHRPEPRPMGGRAAALAREKPPAPASLSAAERHALQSLRLADPERLTPLAALQLLDRLRRHLASGSEPAAAAGDAEAAVLDS